MRSLSRAGSAARAGHHYRFTPRLAEGRWLARQKAVVAMMDVSDGVAKDIQSLTPRGLVASVAPRSIPVSRAAVQAARLTGHHRWEHALRDGEDYELLFVVRAGTNPAAFARRWRRRFALPLHPLGVFARHRAPGDVDWEYHHGYEHLR